MFEFIAYFFFYKETFGFGIWMSITLFLVFLPLIWYSNFLVVSYKLHTPPE